MKRPNPEDQRPKTELNPSDAQSIDAQYGLEPAIEPSLSADESSASSNAQFHWVHCPYCGERFETQLDTSAGSAHYVEDCQICCRPIEFSLEVDHAGALVALSTLRGD
jgi:phage terminase large subunit GpA-like protein